MARTHVLVLVATALALLLAARGASAATPIPGTAVQVVDLGPTTRTVSFGGTANFSWAVFNGDPRDYTLNVTAVVDDPAFRASVTPSSFVVSRDSIVEVYLNVTAPPTGTPLTVTLHVVFQTITPIASNLTRDVSVTLREAVVSVGVVTAFLAIGAIILIGFMAARIFERTRVPDLLILIFLGLLLGPVALNYAGVAFVPPGILAATTPYFTAMALMIILFDGGLNLRAKEIRQSLGIVGVHAGVAFALSFVAVVLVARFLFGYDWIVACLLAAVLDGTSGAVVIGIVRVLRISEETKAILTLESVLTDILAVVIALAFIELLRGGPDASFLIVFQELGEAFLIALGLGLAFGLGWILLLTRMERKPFSYMLTIALLFVLYAMTEALGGSGAMAAFVFGIVLGNHDGVEHRLGLRSRFVIDARIRQFHAEISFLVRTFFFVFLGLVFTFQVGGSWAVATPLPLLAALNGTFLLFLVGVGAIFVLIVVSRLLTTRLTAALRPMPVAERRALWSVMGRGLTTAVLASLPFTIPAFTAPTTAGDLYYRSVLMPYEGQFLNLAFFTILLTVAATTLGVASAERALGAATPPPLRVGTNKEVREFLEEIDLDDLQVHDQRPGP